MQRRQFTQCLLAVCALAGMPAVALARRGGARRRGRPASPRSVAGARRRHVRRRRRRVRRNMRFYSLPYGCSITRVRRGTTYYNCRGIWYRPLYQGTTVVYVVEEIESGAETYVEFEE